MDPVSTRVVQWPKPLEPASFHGIAGEIVRTIEPVSEADPAALLLQFLVAFGNAIGRNAHFLHEDTRHGMNLYAVLVGRTASARKGTSWNRVSRLVTDLDHGWSETRIQSGLSSGEGLVWAVRDDNGKDGAVEDKRLLSVESEFASVLKIMAREGSTLSTTLRQAWDSGMLRTLTKQHAAVATDAHISVLGHITKDELRRYLAETDMANGFGNRFLWVCVKRSKCLPEGGELTSGQRDYIRGRLAPIFAFARQSGELVKDPTARDLGGGIS